MPLRLLLVEDSADDAELVMRELRRAGFHLQPLRVDDPEAFGRALDSDLWDLVISDYNVPGFGAMQALQQMHERGRDLPFIVVSGAIGEDVAVACMKAGAHDYVMKDRLARLGEAVRRELRDAEIRRERAESNEALLRSEARFRELIEMLPDIVLVHVREKIVYANDSAANAFLYADRAELLGRSVRDLFHSHAIAEEDSLQALVRADCEPSQVIEVIGRRRDLTDRVMESSAKRVVFNGQEAVLLVTRDVSERRELTSRMMRLDRLAAVGMLAAGVAHEVNNPLAYVRANLEFACEEVGRLASADPSLVVLAEALRDAADGAERIRVIANDLRTFSRRDETPASAFDVGHAIDAALKMAAFRARHRARIVTDLEPTPPVCGTESRIAQVVLNLVVNALDAINGNDPTRNLITVRTRRVSAGVHIEVSDNGPGIPEPVRARIFEPFFTTKPADAGTGLGLSLSRNIVREVGGELQFESEAGVGTTFRIFLPSTDEDAVVTPSGT